MTDGQFLTEEGAEELRRELKDLKEVKRIELAARLKEAISQGDLSENADYHDAKEQQAFLEGRIQYLEALLRNATVVKESDTKPNMVRVGVEVTVQEEGESPETYIIVGGAEANSKERKISNESPLGQALMGHKVGDKVTYQAPAGKFSLKIKAIKKV